MYEALHRCKVRVGSQTGRDWRGLWGHRSLVLRSTDIQRHWSFKVDLLLGIPLCPLLSHKGYHLQYNKHSGVTTPYLTLHSQSLKTRFLGPPRPQRWPLGHW